LLDSLTMDGYYVAYILFRTKTIKLTTYKLPNKEGRFQMFALYKGSKNNTDGLELEKAELRSSNLAARKGMECRLCPGRVRILDAEAKHNSKSCKCKWPRRDCNNPVFDRPSR